MSDNRVLLAMVNPEVDCSNGIEMFNSWVLFVIARSFVIRVKLFAWISVKVVCWIPKDPVTLARALIERFPTCWAVKLPQLVKTGSERERPAALDDTVNEVSTWAKVGIEIVLKYLLFVMENISALLRLIPDKLSREVSVI